MFQLLRAEFYQIRHRVVPFTMLLLSYHDSFRRKKCY